MNEELNSQNPYPGPRPFERDEENIFFGRDREVRNLRSIIIAQRVILLYSQSGAGKTSLLNAGIIPCLAEEGFEVMPVARVLSPFPEDIDPKDISNIYIFNTLRGWVEDPSDSTKLLQMSLPGFLRQQARKVDEEGFPLRRLVIFDQFEELFTTYPERWEEREDFIKQLAKALEEDSLLKVLFVMREEYLAGFEAYADLIPEKLRTRYRLERLGSEAARSAVEGPLTNSNRLFAEGVVADLVQQLLEIRIEGATGDMRATTGDYVEPVQLQIVCQNLWESLPPAVTVITNEHLQAFGDVNESLIKFYDGVIRSTIKASGVKERKLRTWFDRQLITPAWTRGMVFRGITHTGEIPNVAVDQLEDKHIIRTEMRAGSRWHELTHDKFIEPIKRSNKNWFKAVRRTRLILKGAGIIGLLLVVMTSSYWLLEQSREEYRRTEGQIQKLRSTLPSLPKESQSIYPESILDNVVSYLWINKEVDKLVNLLKYSEDLIPDTYGLDPLAGYLMPFVDANVPWPITLEYNARLKLNQGQLQYQWRYIASRMTTSWGVPVPMRLKLKENSELREDQIRVLLSFTNTEAQVWDSATKSPEKVVERFFNVLSQPGHVVISELDIPPGDLKTFFDQHKRDWTPLKEDKFVGKWWLVPRWTMPIFKAGGCRTAPREGAIAVVLGNNLLDEPELILTPDCVKYLLERLRISAPRTVEEAVAIRVGMETILEDLVNVVKLDYPLVRLRYLLDTLANYPNVSSKIAASYAIEDQQSISVFLPYALPGKQPETTIKEEEEELPKSDFPQVFEEASRWLPELEPQVRVYLGRNLLTRFSSNGWLKPELLEALADLRGDIYKQFGLVVPPVIFRPEEVGLEDDALRIEVLNQTEKDEDASAIDVSQEKALETLLRELKLRYVAFRTWWLTPEYVESPILQTLPKNLLDWIKEHYSLTDLKLVLREVIAPSEAEIECYSDFRDEEAFQEINLEQTLQHVSWLLGSLVFWVNYCDPKDGEKLASHLRDTQKARLSPNHKGVPEGGVEKVVERGIDTMTSGKIEEASELYNKARELDPSASIRAFLALYPQQRELLLENELARLEQECSLPEPGRISTAFQPKMETRWDVEEFLRQFEEKVSTERQRGLRLYLLWSYVAERHYNKVANSLEQFLSLYNTEQWSPEEKYFLAYLMLKNNAPNVNAPEHLSQIKQLLKNAFLKLDESRAGVAFYELSTEIFEGFYPHWYYSMLISVAELYQKSFWVPYILGAHLTDKNQENAEMALILLDRANENISMIETDDRNRFQAWIDYWRAIAYKTLIRYSRKKDTAQKFEKAKALLSNLIDSIPKDDKDWPDLGLVYSCLCDILVWEEEIEAAARVVEKGLVLFPNSSDLLFAQFFLYLAQEQTTSAVELARRLSTGPQGEDSNVLFLVSLAQILTGQGEFEYAARRFLATKHEYLDYIRMMLFWSLCREGKYGTAKELLYERWEDIDPSGWSARMEHCDPYVWREQLIGYYLGEVKRKEIFWQIKDRQTFEQSFLGKSVLTFREVKAEALFYDALLQGVTGDLLDRKERQLKGLENVLKAECFGCYEHHMARYIIHRIGEDQQIVDQVPPFRNVQGP